MTTDVSVNVQRTQDLSAKVGRLYQRRAELAREHLNERLQKSFAEDVGEWQRLTLSPMEFWNQLWNYGVDFAQRSVLFWDTLRQRGNNFVEHERAGKPPLLHFDYELVLDARTSERPVNYALVRIIPPQGVVVDPKRRPYLIIDPRAGHGPGVGGFKDDSQVGVALREGHPVYFVIFFPEPQPGQTLLDVCHAEHEFVHKVRELHPGSPRPVVIGNCQGGWAAMMLAASAPDDTGPIVINGAPMSYWGGAWEEGENDNPMRYSGGLLGGSWLASFVSDLGNGKFDGAWLVQNFENLNPANSLWDKYYHVFANVDTEPPRFLEFERWWGGFYLLNREEIEWITQNLFVGNKIWTGTEGEGAGGIFDLRNIRSPIILFASMGDNITPPEQAFNWVADVYGSTEEIKARGQVIVGLLHQDIGHLGIFVSGRVAKKEHAQIVSVLKSIEALPPGLYGMRIKEARGADGRTLYDVEFVEHRLEDVVSRLNRFQRADEKPFEAVAAIAEFNQRAYELFVQPMVQAMANEPFAKFSRDFHPLRWQRWAFSDLNPWLAWLQPAANMVKEHRQGGEGGTAFHRLEKMSSEMISASLDYYRQMRDATSEALFFLVYGNLFSVYLADKHKVAEPRGVSLADPRELPVVREALANIDQGGYPEALARVAYLLERKGEPLPLSRLALKHELIQEYRDFIPDTTPDQRRLIRGEQELIVRFEPEQAIGTLPKLLHDPADRARLLKLLELIVADARIQNTHPTAEQEAMLKRIRAVLGAGE